MSIAIQNLKDIPAHVWLGIVMLILVIVWEIRPDETIKNMLIGVFSAWLTALTTNKKDQP
jgi:hypothetical protein